MNAFPFQAKRSWSFEIGKGEKNPKWGDLKSNSCEALSQLNHSSQGHLEGSRVWTNIVVASGQTWKGVGTGQVRERKPKWKLN